MERESAVERRGHVRRNFLPIKHGDIGIFRSSLLNSVVFNSVVFKGDREGDGRS